MKGLKYDSETRRKGSGIFKEDKYNAQLYEIRRGLLPYRTGRNEGDLYRLCRRECPPVFKRQRHRLGYGGIRDAAAFMPVAGPERRNPRFCQRQDSLDTEFCW